uniref:hypothetical protein n=1 Tax=Helicobacter salomonis TaxID=56878 RepID=UPI001315882C
MKNTLILGLFLLNPPLFAHPFASYLDGAFVSFGMNVGGGSALESVRSAPDANAAKIAAYQANLQAYNNALAQLKANQAQTLTQLQKYAQQLASLNPNATQVAQILSALQNHLSRTIQAQAFLAGLSQDTSNYQNYLNQLVSSYQAKNQALLNQAQESIAQYESALKSVNQDNQQTLIQALNTLSALNTQAAQAAKELGITYTPITPPVQSSQVSSLSPAQVIQAIGTLASDIQALASTIGTDIDKLKSDDKQVILQNASKVAQLTNAANAAKAAAATAATAASNAKANAFSQIASISQKLGQAFHNQWMQYAVGEAWGVNNFTYANSGRTCIISNIVSGNTSFVGPNYCGGSTFPNIKLPSGLSLPDMWNTLFNVAQLAPYANSKYIGAEAYFDNPRTQAYLKQAWDYMNSYLSPNNFQGNFAGSKLATMFENALSGGDFTQAQSLLTNYTQDMIPYMLYTFYNIPYWIAYYGNSNTLPGPFCHNTGALFQGLNRCETLFNTSITLLGALSFTDAQMSSIESAINAQGKIAAGAINNAQSAQTAATQAQVAATKAQQALSDFKPTPLPYPIPP